MWMRNVKWALVVALAAGCASPGDVAPWNRAEYYTGVKPVSESMNLDDPNWWPTATKPKVPDFFASP